MFALINTLISLIKIETIKEGLKFGYRTSNKSKNSNVMEYSVVVAHFEQIPHIVQVVF